MSFPNIQGKNYVFTIFFQDNIEIDDAEFLMDQLPLARDFDGSFGHAQIEICPSTKKLHIQGFVCLDKNVRGSRFGQSLTNISNLFKHPTIDLMKGSIEDNITYCTKLSCRAPGTEPITWGIQPQKQQGKRTDLLDAVESLRSLPQDLGLAQKMRRLASVPEHQTTFVKFSRGLTELATALETRQEVPPPTGGWSPWQKSLQDRLASTPDRRSIVWIYDQKGKMGKSHLVLYHVSRYEAVCLEGKLQDMAYTYNRERIAFFDIPRAGSEHCDHLYRMGEQLKNGFLNSTKYTPCVKVFSPPHVVYMSNSPPPTGAWSEDRLVLYTLHADGTFQIDQNQSPSSQHLFHPTSHSISVDISSTENPFAEVNIPQIDDLSQLL